MATTISPSVPHHQYNDNNDSNNNNRNSNNKSDIDVVEDIAEIRTCRTTRSPTLDVSQRKLKVIPEGLLQLTHLQCLYLQGNLLSDLPSSLFEYLHQLTWLDLRHNNLHQLNPQIGLLNCLKSLLLEGNYISKLPVELGLLTKLTGLNLKGNPLEFPPKNIVDQGLKTILKYLREHHLCSNLHNDECIPPQVADDEKQRHITDVLFDDDSTDEDSPDLHGNQGRSTKMLDTSLRQLQLHSAPARRLGFEEKKKQNKMKKKKEFEKDESVLVARRESGYMPKEPIQSTHRRQLLDAERRSNNEQVDAIIQKRRDKVVLDEWRKQTTALQRTKRRSRSAPKHEIVMPYGNDISTPSTMKHMDEEENELLHAKLDERIQEHVRNIKEWRQKTEVPMTLQEELQETKNNLEKAQKLQRILEKKKTLDTRSNTFDYNAMSDALAKEVKDREKISKRL